MTGERRVRSALSDEGERLVRQGQPCRRFVASDAEPRLRWYGLARCERSAGPGVNQLGDSDGRQLHDKMIASEHCENRPVDLQRSGPEAAASAIRRSRDIGIVREVLHQVREAFRRRSWLNCRDRRGVQ